MKLFGFQQALQHLHYEQFAVFPRAAKMHDLPEGGKKTAVVLGSPILLCANWSQFTFETSMMTCPWASEVDKNVMAKPKPTRFAARLKFSTDLQSSASYRAPRHNTKAVEAH